MKASETKHGVCDWQTDAEKSVKPQASPEEIELRLATLEEVMAGTHPRNLEWTSEKPTVSGWYWLLDKRRPLSKDNNPKPAYVSIAGQEVWVSFGQGLVRAADLDGLIYAGQLVPPEC